MERLTEKHYLAEDHYMKCSEDCNVDMDCVDCPALGELIERLAAYEDIAELCGGLDRLRELTEADKAGRCVVLPCKVGDVLYAAESDPVTPLHVMAVAIYLELGGEADGDYERISNIGETVFLTREEAERAMEGRKDD